MGRVRTRFASLLINKKGTKIVRTLEAESFAIASFNEILGIEGRESLQQRFTDLYLKRLELVEPNA